MLVYVRVIWVQATETDSVNHRSSGSRENQKGVECRCKGGGQRNMAEEGMFPLKREEEAEERHGKVCMCDFVGAKQGAGQAGGR